MCSEAGGFRLVYGMAAVMYALAALVAAFRLEELPLPARRVAGDPDGAAPGPPGASRLRLASTALAFVLLQCPLTLAVQALPLFIDAELDDDPPAPGWCWACARRWRSR
ncbi:hypothetical protein V2I01_34315 [Micromonospora sp. BRA006-A]|nr:hypothetical protein [Micromonospora sp. BRA006-A]